LAAKFLGAGYSLPKLAIEDIVVCLSQELADTNIAFNDNIVAPKAPRIFSQRSQPPGIR